MSGLRAAHRFLLDHGTYLVLGASWLSVALLLFRFAYSGEPRYLFLLWNLFLAWIPYGCALIAAWAWARRPWGTALIPPLAAAWLLFLPNAPYLITDLIHLPQGGEVPRWFDAAMLTLFAWCGVALGVYSLRAMARIVHEVAGREARRLFVPLICALSGYGIYLGRVERWNSWDLLVSTRDLLAAILADLRDPLADPAMLGISVLYAALFLGAYLTIGGRGARGARGGLETLPYWDGKAAQAARRRVGGR